MRGKLEEGSRSFSLELGSLATYKSLASAAKQSDLNSHLISIENLELPNLYFDTAPTLDYLLNSLKTLTPTWQNITVAGNNVTTKTISYADWLVISSILKSLNHNLTLDLSGFITDEIPPQCFNQCDSLYEVILPSVQYIGGGAFDLCHRLTKVSLPMGLESIGIQIFSNCYALKEIMFPPNCEIPNNYFDSITAPYSLEVIVMPHTEYQFGSCLRDAKALRTVIFSPTQTSITGLAFSGCYSLKEVEIPESVTEMYGSFRDCINLQFVTLNAPPSGAITNQTFRTGKLDPIQIWWVPGDCVEEYRNEYPKDFYKADIYARWNMESEVSGFVNQDLAYKPVSFTGDNKVLVLA